MRTLWLRLHYNATASTPLKNRYVSYHCVYTRAIYTSKNKPRLKLAAAKISRERDRLYGSFTELLK